MRRNVTIVVPFVSIILVLAGAWLMLRYFALEKEKPSPQMPLGHSGPPATGSTSTHPPRAQPHLNAVAIALNRASHPDQARQLLNDLRQSLADRPARDAVHAIRTFLDSKSDAPTGLPFKLGPGGLLSESPSLRVFLLDYLAQIDPSAAAACAKDIFQEMNSPDEWAVALRNVARATPTPEVIPYLKQKMTTLLSYEPWQENPSTGYLLAFDLAVHVGGTDLMPLLAALLKKKDNPAVAHAAYLALDRLTINNPALTLHTLLQEPQLMQGREKTRANYFARADVRHPEQRALLEHYLLEFQPNSEELNTFFGLFPNANYMVSYNLVTPDRTPDRATLLQRDRAALLTIQDWLADPRFQTYRPQLETMRTRLESFTQ